MPPPLDANREAVRILAQEIGVRPAARACGLNEDTVSAWSAREGWLKQLPPPATVAPTSTASKSPALAHAELMAELGGKTRLGLAKGLSKAAEHVAELPGESILAQAGEVASLTKSASQVHGWENQQDRSGPVLVNIDLRNTQLEPVVEVVPAESA